MSAPSHPARQTGSDFDLVRLLGAATQAEMAGRSDEARRQCERILLAEPGHPDATLIMARQAAARRDMAGALELLQISHNHNPGHGEVALQLALSQAAEGNLTAALGPLEKSVEHEPERYLAWLVLSLVRDRLGQAHEALLAAYQAVTRAQAAGLWLDEATTPRDWLGAVVQAITRVRQGRRALFLDALAALRTQHGNEALARIDLALAAYLREIDLAPASSHHRPLFFYFPGLPDAPYFDADLQPWAPQLRAAFPDIRAEAVAMLAGTPANALPDFIASRDSMGRSPHLGGAAEQPSWQAFFFYRRGHRFHDNHSRCPATSAVLDSLDLCRIPDQAPEICFSVLRPHTTIKPHHGITNARLVMHLPLLVPEHCALHLHGGGTHEWREGELVMFDDTFLHEAWNRSAQTRVILLMDCWNPHLTEVERQAFSQLVTRIGSLKAKTEATA